MGPPKGSGRARGASQVLGEDLAATQIGTPGYLAPEARHVIRRAFRELNKGWFEVGGAVFWDWGAE